MKVEKILEDKGSQVYTVQVDAIVSDALAVFVEKKVGALLVLDDRGDIQGIISERDVMRNCHSSQANVKGLAVRQVMTPKERLVVAGPGDDIDYVMNVITEKRIRHVPIVDAKGKLCGIVSVGDIIKALLTHKDHEIKYLKDYIESKYPV